MSQRPPADFRPRYRTARYFDLAGPVTWPRLLLRVAVFVLALAAVDVAVGGTLGDRAFLGDYRLPRDAPVASLPGYLHALDRRARSRGEDALSVAFVGASPTWGHRISRAANTYPYAFGRAAGAQGVQVQAANLASNGQLIGDEYLIARRAAEHSDAVYVQLTYHTFNPSARGARLVRYPELPRTLRLDLAPDEAALLRLPEQRGTAASRAFSRFLAGRWALFRERNALTARLLGGTPEQRLQREWAALAAGETTAGAVRGRAGEGPSADAEDALFQPTGGEFSAFEELEPGQQMVIVSRYAEESSFTVSPDSPQMRVLEALAASLKASGTKAVFFMAPMNRDVIDGYFLIDPAQYRANSTAIGRVVERAGFPYIDYNTADVPLFPGTLFADIDHTTDRGGVAVGEQLARDTLGYLRSGEVTGAP